MIEPQITIEKVANIMYGDYDKFNDEDKKSCQEFVASVIIAYFDNLNISKTTQDKIDWFTGEIVQTTTLFKFISTELKAIYPESV